MAALIPSASASGSGTMTLSGPSTNSNQTITIPDATGTMMVSGNMPAFYLTKSGTQSVTGGVTTKVTFDTKTFDTASIFNTSTSVLTPNVSGYYQINILIGFGTTGTSAQINLFKNGSLAMNAPPFSYNSSIGGQMALSTLIYMNGTTDYLEVYTYGPLTFTASSGSQNTQFSGFLARTA